MYIDEKIIQILEPYKGETIDVNYVISLIKTVAETEQCTIKKVRAPLTIGCLTIIPFEDDDYIRVTVEGAYEAQTELISRKDLPKLQAFINGL